jgi:hypothetical protein
MKLLKLILPSLILACASAHAVTTTVNFDGLTSGDAANLDPAVTGFSFSFGTLEPELDGFGVPIPGTDHWVTDVSAGSPTAVDTVLAGYGAAPTGALALDATPQTVLINFSTPVDLTSFQVTLDNSPFGTDIFTADFYGPGDILLASIPVLQSVPSSVVSATNLSGVSYAVLPSGAMYDSLALTFTPVPEPSISMLALGAFVPLVRRKRRAC